MKKQYRNVIRQATARQRAKDGTQAAQIDRLERDEIIDQGRRVKAQCDLLRAAITELKGRRERLGLSLAQVATRSGIDKAALSRLETAINANPKIDTLLRYANAIGAELRLSVEQAA